MRIIIAGGRDFTNYEYLKKQVDTLISLEESDVKVEIVCGMARGSDLLGKKYAEERGYGVIEMPADWDRFGKSAGYRRNEEMAIKAKEDENCMLIAFWDGKSTGTKHMINLAQKHGVPDYIFPY